MAAQRALNPREKEGGRMEKRWVWKWRVYAEKMVSPSLNTKGINEESGKMVEEAHTLGEVPKPCTILPVERRGLI